jgi:Septum formation initiator.
MKTEIAKLNSRKIDLLEKQKIYENEIVRLNTPSYIEKLAREQLGLVRHGEIIIAPKK